jgi:asparagine synthase (glutamine-hydrolysing)
MCGIAGVVDFSSSRPEESLLRRMLGLIRHRGPDAFGIYTDDHTGLAHARLSIIDLSGGDQPIHNEDRTVWIVYNGEVFNYPELRERLEQRGHRFYTHTDTEVLVHLYEDKGPELFKELNGQFAVAIWDQRKKRLLLGRDRVGIRPLYYFRDGQRFVFGSEIKALFADSRIPRAIDHQALGDIFTCWSSLGSQTPFQGVCQLLPGHYALLSEEGMAVHPYWQLPAPIPEGEPRALDAWTGELKDLLYDATRIRLRADVPVGSYLSGGLDSTYISSLVKRSFNNHLCTFSVKFADSRFDETFFQERAIRSLKTDHQSVRCADGDIGNNFPRVVWHTETPILRTAPAPLFQLSKLVRDSNFKVVLTGEGADEIFAGYNIFKEDSVRRFWARQPASKLRPRLLEKLYPYIFAQADGRTRSYLERFFRKNLSEVDLPWYSHMLRWENTSQIKSFLDDGLKEQLDRDEEFVERYRSSLPPGFQDWDPLSRAQHTEMRIFLSNYLLSSQGDRMAMANAVEGRFPFLDHRVVEFAFRVPPRYRLNVLNEKFILKQAAQDLIPPEIAERPKQPYRAPISRCFFGEHPPDYLAELLCENSLRQAGYFHPGRVAKLVAKCRRQEGNLANERENMALVGILSTQLVDHLFVRDFPPHAVREPEDVTVFRFQST